MQLIKKEEILKVTIAVKLLNSDYNQTIADDFHDGDESEDNIKYQWEDEFIVKGDVSSFKIRNNATYSIMGVYATGDEFNFNIPNTTIVECITEDGLQQFAFSRKLVKTTEKTDKSNGDVKFTIELKDEVPFENPVDGVYITSTDFPKELKQIEN